MIDDIARLHVRMDEAAAALDFETARRLRDEIALLRAGASPEAAAAADTGESYWRMPLTDELRALGERPGTKATLLQFSSAFCAPCRATRRTLADVAGMVDGVAHVEVDAELHLELVRRLGILKTPTTLVLDADGVEVLRASGQPRKADVLAALGRAVP